MVAGSRIGPEPASAANAASISLAIVWRVASAGLFASISLAVGPIVSAWRASSSRVPQMILTEDQSTYIPLGTAHRLENPGKIPLHLIEVQSGSYLGEDDIVRLEDSYGRT